MRLLSILVVSVLSLYFVVSGFDAPAAQGGATVDPDVFAQLAASPTGEATFLVQLEAQADLSWAAGINDRTARKMAVARALKSVADESQAPLLSLLARLERQGLVSRYQSFFAANALAVTGREGAVHALASTPSVARIEAEQRGYILGVPLGPAAPPGAAVEPNIAQINADEVWALGFRGQGTIVAGSDTGLRHTHEALRRNYLCGVDGPHRNCWLDAINGQPVPYDDNSHGTHTLGTAAGKRGIGVAKSAGVIACKWITGGGFGTSTDAIECGNWFLSLALNADTAVFTPDVVNNSWRLGGPGITIYNSIIKAWLAAGIVPAFALGNSGPSCMTGQSPGEYTRAFAAGAVGSTDVIAGFSSRGPGSAPNGGSVKPDVVAPGVNVRSATSGCDTCYGFFSGTSMASPHVAGTVALMRSKRAGLDPGRTRRTIEGSAKQISDLSCGGSPSDNNVYGHGRVDALAAINNTP